VNAEPVNAGTARHTSAWVWPLAGAFLRPASLVSVGLVVGALLPLSVLTTGLEFCPFKVATGLPCPGCGITRASVAFLHGDITTSFFYHPLGAPLVLAAVVIGVLDAWYWWRSRAPGQPPSPPSWLIERVMLSPAPWAAIAALVIVWLVRLPLYVLGTWVF
jgi:hypothetical protein